MRVVISSVGPNLESPMSYSFGRSPYFLVVETDTMELLEVLENPAVNYGRGAGIAAANLVASKANTVITGNVGPNAFSALAGLGVKAFSVPQATTVRQAIELFKQGKTLPIAAPTSGFGPGYGQGFGRGMGRGGGRGRGGRWRRF